MFEKCPLLQSITIGSGWTKSLENTGLPDPLYGADGTACALKDVQFGVAATYYTELGFVSQGHSAGKDDDEAGAPETSAAGRDNKSDAGSVQDTVSENDSSEGSDSPEGPDSPEGSDSPESSDNPEGSDDPEGFDSPEGPDSPEGSDDPAANGQDETLLAA